MIVRTIAAVVSLAGAIALVTGVGLYYPPAGLALAGLLALLVGVDELLRSRP